MFIDQWARRRRSMPILPGINGGYGSFDDRTSFAEYGKRGYRAIEMDTNDIDDILGQGFIGK